MNPRKYGMMPALAMATAPYQAEPVKLGKAKRHAVKTKVCGCVKCGATHTTLYKFGENGKDRICGSCWDKHLNNAMDKLAGGLK